MANWGRIFSRGEIEDRRSMAPVAGGLSLAGVLVLVAFNFLTGGDFSDLAQYIESAPQQQPAIESQEFQGEDSYEVFASTVLGSTNDLWHDVFSRRNKVYQPPRLVLFRVATPSGCGTATSEVGPHYCPYDSTIYLDETFFEELTRRFGARGGDVAEAYVIAHEAGHHAQNMLGITDSVISQIARNPSVEQDLSIKQELQADCFAGLWAYSVQSLGVFESDEILEAIDAAAAVGDDRIQSRVTGQVSPETWTHGSSEQRVSWFNKGYTSGSYESCNTFN